MADRIEGGARKRRVKLMNDNQVLFRCPACKENHYIKIGAWSWNDDLDYPTFSPSVLVQGIQWAKNEYPEYFNVAHANVEPGGDTVCHSFVTNGQIQFLNDCTHSLAGHTIDLPEWDADD